MKSHIKIGLMSLSSLFALLVLLPVTSCNSDSGDDQDTQHVDFNLNDTTEINIKESVYNQSNDIELLYDSLVQDCRCPINANCIWAGYATAHLILGIGDDFETSFNLYVNQDTVIKGFNFKLIDCLPYPDTQNVPDESEYKVIMLVTDAVIKK